MKSSIFWTSSGLPPRPNAAQKGFFDPPFVVFDIQLQQVFRQRARALVDEFAIHEVQALRRDDRALNGPRRWAVESTKSNSVSILGILFR